LWLERDPDARAAVVRRAWVSERLLNTNEAIDGYRRGLELDEERDRREGDRVRLRPAELLVQVGHASEALEHFEVLAGRPKRSAAVVLGLARCLRALGRTERAAELLGRLIAEDPRAAPALAERGLLALEQGKADEAESWLRRA